MPRTSYRLHLYLNFIYSLLSILDGAFISTFNFYSAFACHPLELMYPCCYNHQSFSEAAFFVFLSVVEENSILHLFSGPYMESLSRCFQPVGPDLDVLAIGESSQPTCPLREERNNSPNFLRIFMGICFLNYFFSFFLKILYCSSCVRCVTQSKHCLL